MAISRRLVPGRTHSITRRAGARLLILTPRDEVICGENVSPLVTPRRINGTQ